MSLQAQEKLSKEEKERREKNIQAGNPFAQFGYKAKIATLSKGKYLEFHDLDSIVTIGTVRWHVYKNKIVGHLVQDSLNLDSQPIGDRTGRWISPDPLSEEFPSWSPYTMCFDNPLRYTDPTGMAPDDFVKRKDGSIYWDNNANSQATTKSGETYLGKILTFNFNSYIDKKLWDGPMGDKPAGDKLTSILQITGNENSKGELTSISATRSVKVGDTPMGTARDYYPGEGGSNNTFSLSKTSTGLNINFEQHASVSLIEEFGMNLMGYKIVDVAQKLNINYNNKNGNLAVSSYTGIFPSATLSVNGSQIMKYNQPSFTGTHSAPQFLDYRGYRSDFSYYKTSFNKR